MKNLPFDPNLKPQLEQLNSAINGALKKDLVPSIQVTYTHLKPTKVLINKPNKFKAIYKDDYGKYPFEIKKSNNSFTVIVDKQVVAKTNDKDYLIWNFEVQLAAISPRILLN